MFRKLFDSDWLLLSSLSCFLIYCLIVHGPRVQKAYEFWSAEAEGRDVETLRKTHDRYYRKFYDAITAIRVLPTDIKVVLDFNQSPPWFVTFYIAPRKAYQYTERIVEILNSRQKPFVILSLAAEGDKVKWTLKSDS